MEVITQLLQQIDGALIATVIIINLASTAIRAILGKITKGKHTEEDKAKIKDAISELLKNKENKNGDK